jgi:hypothetical protein
MGIGIPQFAAAGLLLAYLLQCLWLVHLQVWSRSVTDSSRELRVYYGLEQWKSGAIAGTPDSLQSEAARGLPSSAWNGELRVRDGYDEDHSPLHYLIAAALFVPNPWTSSPTAWQFFAGAPYLFFGVMLGGSLWYVARRLFGNAGGYIALTLYCFSPAMVANAAGWSKPADMGAVWGTFGTVFTAIAVAHTLYAPREVILWNWRRILLLGLSLALAIGNQFSLVVMGPLALLLMWWVAPVRKAAAFAIWGAACSLAVLIVFASYFFDFQVFWQGLLHARWFDFEPRAWLMKISYLRPWQTIASGSPALVLALPASLITFLLWTRSRYFSNALPLLVAALLVVFALGAPQLAATTFLVAALTFLFVFIAGILADLLETRAGAVVSASVLGLLIAAAAWNVLQLVRAT